MKEIRVPNRFTTPEEQAVFVYGYQIGYRLGGAVMLVLLIILFVTPILTILFVIVGVLAILGFAGRGKLKRP